MSSPVQVFKVFSTYAEGTSLRVLMLAGQKSLSAEEASLSQCRLSAFPSAQLRASLEDCANN